MNNPESVPPSTPNTFSVQLLSNPENSGSTLREYLPVLMKHWRMMAVLMAMSATVAWAYTKTVKPVWQATATVKLPSENTSGDPMQELLQMNTSEDPEETYMEIAKSFNVAFRVAQSLALTNTAQFTSAHNLTEVAEGLRGSFTVTTIEGSGILSFTLQADNGKRAAELANAWAQAFIDVNLDFDRVGAVSRRDFIESQMTALEGSLTSGENALAQLSKHQGVVRQAGVDGKNSESTITSLQERVQDLELERSTLASRYNGNYPELKEVDAEYRQALRDLNRQVSQMPMNDLEYARVAREVNANESMYNQLLEKDQETRISENVDDSGIVIVDQALPGTAPVAPQKGRIMVLSLVIGLLVSLFAATSLERWLDHVGGEADLAKLSALPVLALIPNWRLELRNKTPDAEQKKSEIKDAEKTLGDADGLIIQSKLHHTYYRESFNVLRTNLAFSQVDKQIKSICILSANASEGKTSTNVNLALALAASGKKVLLVDADLRKPRVHKIFGLRTRSDQGLPFVLSGQCTLESQLVQGPIPELWILPCGVIAPNPSELMGSTAFGQVLKEMGDRFDNIVFDVPPILPVTDGVVLARRLDGVAILSRYEQTRRAELRRALEHLRAVKAPLLGMILNWVDMTKYSYTYGYRGTYYNYQANETR